MQHKHDISQSSLLTTSGTQEQIFKTNCEYSLEFCKHPVSQKKSKLILHFVAVCVNHTQFPESVL